MAMESRARLRSKRHDFHPGAKSRAKLRGDPKIMQNKEQAVGVDQLRYHSRWSTPQRGHEVRQHLVWHQRILPV